MNRFYITTPIFYVNDKPHLGTGYSIVMADVLNRFHKLFGHETFFLTGTDEHGQKVQAAAEKRGMTPKAHCDDMVKNFQKAWAELNIGNDFFIRTTDEFHVKAVQAALQELWDKGDIYADEYEGWYSVSEEIFYTEKDLVNGKSPAGKEVTQIKEKNYFFKMSKYQQALIDLINKEPDLIQPDFRKNEVLGFLRQPLTDLCISRPKARLAWGIEIPFDKDYVTYVWFDALLNYATGVGYKQEKKAAEFKKWWTEAGAVHILGKDILTTHAVYWPTMLMALGIRIPKMLFAHGWILNKENAKMSKSVGDVFNPVELKKALGLDQLRYFLVRDIHFGNDAPFSLELVESRINTDLANNLGNILSRTSQLVGKYFDGKFPAYQADDASSKALKDAATAVGPEVKNEIEAMRPSFALEKIMLVLTQANKYLEETAPWKMAKEDPAKAGHVLATVLETARIATVLLSPVMPEKSAEILKRLSTPQADWTAATTWGLIKPNALIEKGDPIFPRSDLMKA
jgi:methionyl-tRNA synthetase